jgi:mono/diheme cytochrome c family protein
VRRGAASAGLFLLALVGLPTAASAQWLDLDVPPRPGSPEALVDAGRALYDTHCWTCHGEEGDGLGPVADYLWPRPRDFTIASFKLRTTPSGELPTDEDLYRSISLGLPGSAMPAWRSVLTPAERWQVIAYIKTFGDGMFEDEAFDPYATVIEVGDPPTGGAPALVEAGRQVYRDSDCWECHGEAGRGDGPKAPDLLDDWGYPIWAADLELAWKFRGGRTPMETYVRLSTGLDGTPMPSYAETLSEEKRWQVAYYVASLGEATLEQAASPVVISAARIDGPVPADPADPAWSMASANAIPLTGQATYAPRWQNPAVTDLLVQALYGSDEVALRIRWNDRTADTIPGTSSSAAREGWTSDDTWPVLFPDGRRERATYRDALEILFPAADHGPVLPHFVYGDPLHPVDVWRWTADRLGDGSHGAMERLQAMGDREPPRPPAPASSLESRAEWVDGQWTLVVRRPLSAGEAMAPGSLVPVAFHVRDGAHGETGLRMALSSWYYLHLREPAGMAEALVVLLALLATAAAEFLVVRHMRRRARSGKLEAYGIRSG